MSIVGNKAERVPLTRARIFEAAMALADDDGIQSLTMRRLADQLGVEAMSIYHHLPGKNAILDGLAELLFVEIEDEVEGFGVPDAGTPWVAVVRGRILGARRIMLRHRWLPGVMENRGVMTPTMARYVDSIVGAMHTGGCSYDLVHHSLHALGSTMFGFNRELMLDSDSPSGEDLTLMRDFVPQLAAMLEEVVHDDPDSTLGWCDDQTEFEFGLDVLLEGLERRRVAETQPASVVGVGSGAGPIASVGPNSTH